MGRPTLSTLAAFAAVFAAQTLGAVVGIGVHAFALAVPLDDRPWTIATSVYAHGSFTHLIANAIALVLVGPLLARGTTSVRFHAFFLGTGAIAGIAQVLLTVPFGGGAVLGASGAIFALFGYLIVGNRVSGRALAWLPLGRRGQLAVLVVVAALLTLATATPAAALVAHFVGFCLGAVAGRWRILSVSDAGSARRR